MDRTDPNSWTPQYVRSNTPECIDFLIETNERIIRLLYNVENAAAIAGLDRVINGLVVMQNAGCGNFRPHISLLSMVEGLVMLFGPVVAPDGRIATESKRRETAISALEDARDFSSSDDMKQTYTWLISEIRSGTSVEKIKAESNVDIPGDLVENITAVNRQLAKAKALGSSGTAAPSPAPKKKSGCMPKLLLIGALVVVVLFAIRIFDAGQRLQRPNESHNPSVSTPFTTAETTKATEPQVDFDPKSVLGKELQDALSLLDGLKLSYKIDYLASAEAPENSVIDCVYTAETGEVLLVVAQAPEIPELSHQRALELVELDLISGFLADYAEAKGVVDYSDVLKVDVDGEFGDMFAEYPSAVGIDTPEQLRAWLSQDFTDRYIDKNFFGEWHSWVQKNGTIYLNVNWGAGSTWFYPETLTVTKQSDGSYLVTCVPEIPGLEPSETPPYQYTVIYEDGGYKVDSVIYT